MVFACQRDSFLKKLTTKVILSTEVSKKVNHNGKVQTVNGYEIILEDTVLFPEGGGQPFDRGTINGVEVLMVNRKGGDAIHFVEKIIEVGAEVELVVDWKRRFDHMQQHSGQHLISAIAEQKLGFKTTSWNLGEDVSFVELDTTKITVNDLEDIENICNEHIRNHLSVDVKVYEEGAEELAQAKTRGLPEDHVGSIRVICIEGIDENMCCGTHVSNLSQLQVIKLLWVDKGKKGKSNLFFLVGNRVIKFVSDGVKKDKLLTSALQCGPQEHVEVLGKIQKAYKSSQKNETSFLKDLAISEAQKFKLNNPLPKLFSLHRNNGNADFMSIIVNEIGNEKVLIFLTVGEQNAGQLMLAGENEVLKEIGPKIMEILDGKGSVNKNKFNGKFTQLKNRQLAEDLIRDFIKEK